MKKNKMSSRENNSAITMSHALAIQSLMNELLPDTPERTILLESFLKLDDGAQQDLATLFASAPEHMMRCYALLVAKRTAVLSGDVQAMQRCINEEVALTDSLSINTRC